MLKELVQYLEQRPAPVIVEHRGKKFSDKELFPIKNNSPEMLNVTTLRAVVDFINLHVDGKTQYPLNRIIVHVKSPIEVVITSECTEDGTRWERVLAKAVIPSIPFGRYMDVETFNITMQTMFVENENRNAVLSVVGNITDGTVTGFKDDGITQSVNIKAGIQRVGTANVPNPVVLAPYRTFPEITQPESPFVLRLKSGSGDSPSAAIFEADGTAWRLEAMQKIREYFWGNIPNGMIDSGEIVIIA